jgi:Prolipoprotein diacylglyceryl transferase
MSLALDRPRSRLTRPRIGKHSAYTVLGFAGHGAANALGVVLARRWELGLGDRLIGFLVPPLAFVLATTVATALKGREWIVFYHALFSALAAVALIGALAGEQLARLVDLTVLGIGAFLVLGRLGCFRVACCHGRPIRAGASRWLAAMSVTYDREHVAAGLWPRLAGHPLVPVQLLEAVASAACVGFALAGSAEPGRAAAIYAAGYACVRFALELWRGDPVRPCAAGLSEAQWASLVLAALVASLWLQAWTAIPFAAMVIAAAALVARRRRRELVQPAHLAELDRLAGAVLADPHHARRDSHLGVGLSSHLLDDGRRDWILSSQHPAWSPVTAQRLAAVLWPQAELLVGRTPGVVHLIEPAAPAPARAIVGLAFDEPPPAPSAR